MGQRAAIYTRVSTADQSCERQVSELTSFAERGGYDVAGIFRETVSVRRPGDGKEPARLCPSLSTLDDQSPGRPS